MRDHIKPRSKLWVYKGRTPPSGAHVYDHIDGTRILSAVENVADDGLNYHISISRNGRRISLQDALAALSGFEAPFHPDFWLEDNHASSIARNFWVHTDPAKRKPCDCISKEKPHQEGDFLWRESSRVEAGE